MAPTRSRASRYYRCFVSRMRPTLRAQPRCDAKSVILPFLISDSFHTISSHTHQHPLHIVRLPFLCVALLTSSYPHRPYTAQPYTWTVFSLASGCPGRAPASHPLSSRSIFTPLTPPSSYLTSPYITSFVLIRDLSSPDLTADLTSPDLTPHYLTPHLTSHLTLPHISHYLTSGDLTSALTSDLTP